MNLKVGKVRKIGYIKLNNNKNITNFSMNLSDDKATEIFCAVDDFYKAFKRVLDPALLGNAPKKPSKMCTSEVITIMILFHHSGFRTMKGFYINYVKVHMIPLFPNTVSYNRFVELMQAANLPLAVFVKNHCMGESTGISFIDSTPVRVCNNKRIPRNKVFADIATRGKSTMGYFFGFKVHLVVNDKGELLNFVITQGNVDDRQPLKDPKFIESITGKLYADKGYISQKLTELLFSDGIHLITQIRNNMKNSLMELKDKILLRKRSIIETINDELKNMCQIEHSRHRSFSNFVSNLLAGLAAYSFFSKKPAIKYDPVYSNQIAIF